MGNPSLRQQAYEKIHFWIVNGNFPKGTVTSEAKLCQMLNMSRTPIRAALQQLELEGYLRIASKHGIILLDSSSQRVSDLLDIIISMALFAVSSSWHSQREELMRCSEKALADYHILLQQKDVLQALVAFEYNWLHELICLCKNDEMTKTFHTSASRLFWNQNVKRWQAPFSNETEAAVKILIDSIAADLESFQAALLTYLHLLKRTWQ